MTYSQLYMEVFVEKLKTTGLGSPNSQLDLSLIDENSQILLIGEFKKWSPL